MLRIGHGYDIHRTLAGRPLVLGGVRFDCPFGLDGHSDADCLTHAICDALLGATGQRLRSAQSGAVQANLAISFAVAALVIAALIYFVA